MSRRRSRERSRRIQKIIAVIVLVAMGGSGLAFYAAANNVQQVPVTGQGH
ncbi:MAG: hypothetical protein ACRDGS_00530 [Chloroflexota bacterium]